MESNSSFLTPSDGSSTVGGFMFKESQIGESQKEFKSVPESIPSNDNDYFGDENADLDKVGKLTCK